MAVIMETLLQQKKQIETLEAEGSVLRHQVSNLAMDPQSASYL